MKISVNIQTYKRVGEVDTLNLVPHANLWAHSFEIDLYRKAYPDAVIKELPNETQGNLPRVKNFILEHEFNKGFDAVLLLDDDIKTIGWWEKRHARTIGSEEELIDMVLRYSILASDWGAKLWGINVNPDKQVYREYSPFSTISYISSSFSCFLKGNELKYDERFPLKEDYDMLLQQTNKYRLNLRVNKYFYVKKSAENKGGCATYRNQEKEKQQMDDLQKKWGRNLVKRESLRHSRSHSSKKRRTIDINPVVLVPIRGI